MTPNRLFAVSAAMIFVQGTMLPQTHENPGSVVINQFQVAGTLSASDEFVELLNKTGSAVSLVNYKLKYYSAGGTSSGTLTFPAGSTKIIPANGYFLIVSSSYDGLTAGDTAWAGGFSPSAGQLVLLNAINDTLDGVAYGTITVSRANEGNPTSAPSSEQSMMRSPDGTDSNSNSADFTVSLVPVARNSSSSPLPIEMSFFHARSIRSNVHLDWKTMAETNNYGFDIERRSISNSQQGISNFERIGFIARAGTSTSSRDYSYLDANLPAGRYAYRIKQIDNDGTFQYYGNAEVEIGTVAKEFRLEPNYPNPFNPSTTIEFILGEDGHASLRVYNVLGQEVATLYEGEAVAGRLHQARFNASTLPSGLYFAKLQVSSANGADKQQMIRKMLLMK